jgi:oligoendopeptidase F
VVAHLQDGGTGGVVVAHGATEFPRRFLPDRIDLGDWARIEPYFQNLALRRLDDLQDLADWLQDFDELSACLHEEQTTRYTDMTCQTDDPEREQRYLHMVEHVRPRVRPWEQKLLQRWNDCPLIEQLPSDVYFVFNRDVRRQIEIYRQENIPLFVEEDKLSQRYQKITGAMTVEYDGREQTLQQMQRYLELPDRDVRRRAWELVTRRRLQDGEAMDDLFDELLRLRRQIAANADFDNYRDYAGRRADLRTAAAGH